MRNWLVLALSALTIMGCSTSGSPRDVASPSSSPSASARASKAPSFSGVFVVNCMDFVESPKELQLYCGDGGQQLSQIMWDSWGKESAFGLATSTKNTCDPDCASGNYDVRTASVMLSEPIKLLDGRKVFSKIALKYDKPLSDGQPEEYLDLPTELTP